MSLQGKSGVLSFGFSCCENLWLVRGCDVNVCEISLFEKTLDEERCPEFNLSRPDVLPPYPKFCCSLIDAAC